MTQSPLLDASRGSPAGEHPRAAGRDDDRLLLAVAAFFTVAVVLHGADHLRRGADTLGRDVFWVGTAAIFPEVAVVVLACQRHRLAPLVAGVTGVSLAVGYVVVHFLPTRSWLSDALVGVSDVSPLSLAAASLEVVAASALGVIGILVLRRRGGLASAAVPHPRQRSLREAVTHPVALAMIFGSMVLLVISVVQLS